MAGIGLVIYYDKPTYGEKLGSVWKKLKALNEANVTLQEGIYKPGQEDEKKDIKILGNQVGALLNEKDWDRLEGVSKEIAQIRGINRYQLFLLIDKVMGHLHHYLESDKIETEKFWEDVLIDHYEMNYQSVENFGNWIGLAVNQLKQLNEVQSSEKVIISTIKRYILNNIEEKITRDQIEIGREHV